jgi:hypothetical protein
MIPLALSLFGAAFGDSGKKNALLRVALHHFTELWKKI